MLGLSKLLADAVLRWLKFLPNSDFIAVFPFIGMYKNVILDDLSYLSTFPVINLQNRIHGLCCQTSLTKK